MTSFEKSCHPFFILGTILYNHFIFFCSGRSTERSRSIHGIIPVCLTQSGRVASHFFYTTLLFVRAVKQCESSLHPCLPAQSCRALLYNHIFFVVRAEEFQLGIVASPSCTEYHWGTLIALYWAVHQAQLMNWQKTSPFGQCHLVKE